jgi:uncharacterized protein
MRYSIADRGVVICEYARADGRARRPPPSPLGDFRPVPVGCRVRAFGAIERRGPSSPRFNEYPPMLYATIWEDIDDSLALRKSVRPVHLKHVNQLVDEGRLVLGGPFPAVEATDPGPAGFTGSMLVAEFPSLADAEQWINDDPYMKAGVIRSFKVKPFIQVVP